MEGLRELTLSDINISYHEKARATALAFFFLYRRVVHTGMFLISIGQSMNIPTVLFTLDTSHLEMS